MDPFDRLGKEGLEWTQRGPAQPNEDDFPRLTTYTTGKFVDMATSQARHWRTAAQALALVRRRDSLTRTELTSLLGLRSGPISDLVKRLVLARLIEEAPAAIEGPGRPTSTLHAHPNGPVAIVLDLRHGDWRLGVCELDGSVHITAHGAHVISNPPMLLDTIASHFKTLTTSLGSRAIGVGVAVPGIVMDGRANMTMRRWPDIDMSPLVNATSIPFVLRNDATLAGMAEARRHPVELNSLLHIVVEVGVGGAFVVDGQPVPSAHGLHGEFGHLPFGNPEVECACGVEDVGPSPSTSPRSPAAQAWNLGTILAPGSTQSSRMRTNPKRSRNSAHRWPRVSDEASRASSMHSIRRSSLLVASPTMSVTPHPHPSSSPLTPD